MCVQGTVAFWFLVLECFWKKYDYFLCNRLAVCFLSVTTAEDSISLSMWGVLNEIYDVQNCLPLLKIVLVWVCGEFWVKYMMCRIVHLWLYALSVFLFPVCLYPLYLPVCLSLCIHVCLPAFPNLPTPSASFTMTVLWYHPVTGQIKWQKNTTTTKTHGAAEAYMLIRWKFENRQQQKATTTKCSKLHI